ncbi:MAG TPA: thiamine-phosphate kinase [Vicinamibacterales bacterium]
MHTPTACVTVSDIGEHALIARITRGLSMPSWVVAGPGDDAAVVTATRGALDALTTDTLGEGVHFDQTLMPPQAIGQRALAVNLSDLAAMGARPRTALLSLALPASLSVAALDGFVEGFVSHAATEGVTLVGGNVTRTTGPWVIGVTATGVVNPRGLLRRTGARPGDGVYVTGWLASAAVGLMSLRQPAQDASGPGPFAECEARYQYPVARVRAGLQLSHHRAASSCMDLSDGLADGVRQLSAASDVGMVIDADALPLMPAVHRWHAAHGTDAVATALTGGDDYELIFTVRPRHAGRLRGAARRCGDLPITRVGVVTASTDLLVRRGETLAPLSGGYEHFR